MTNRSQDRMLEIRGCNSLGGVAPGESGLPFLIITPPNPAPPITGNAAGTNFTTLGVAVGPAGVGDDPVCVTIYLTINGVVLEPVDNTFNKGLFTSTLNHSLATALNRDGLKAVGSATDVKVTPDDTVVLNSLTLTQKPCHPVPPPDILANP